MKHIDLKVKNKNKYGIGDVIASIEGNSFGDQIIHFRVYSDLTNKKENADLKKQGFKVSGFVTTKTLTNYEGEHMTVDQMKKVKLK